MTKIATKSVMVLAAAGLMMASLAPVASAQNGAPAARPSGNPQRDTLVKMQRSITTDLTDVRLEDAVKFIAETTGAQIEPLWKTDRGEGLDKESTVTLSVKGLPAIAVLEKIMTKAVGDEGEETSWQFNEFGALQIGLKKSLNKFKRVEVYDIHDLLLVVPIYNEAPTVDLQQALQQGGGGGGGGGQSPFQANQQNRRIDPEQVEQRRRQRVDQEIIPMITALCEPTQWLDGGGEINRPRYFQGHIIVDAPDYMHRALNGYRWWPSTSFSSGSGGRRYVSMTTDSANSTVAEIRALPVPAVGGGG